MWKNYRAVLWKNVKNETFFGRLLCTGELELVLEKGYSTLQKQQKANTVGLGADQV